MASEVIYLDLDSLGTAGWTLDFPWEFLRILTPAPGVAMEVPAEDSGPPGPAEKQGGRERNTASKSFCCLRRISMFPKAALRNSEYKEVLWLNKFGNTAYDTPFSGTHNARERVRALGQTEPGFESHSHHFLS